MKETYRRMQAKPRDGRPYREVQFIVAGIVPDRTNVVERARVRELVRRAVSSDSVSQRNWMPDSVMQILLIPTEETRVHIPGAPAVVLGVMRSPKFKLDLVDPLACVAIGSGHGAAVEMERAADWILTNGSDECLLCSAFRTLPVDATLPVDPKNGPSGLDATKRTLGVGEQHELAYRHLV